MKQGKFCKVVLSAVLLFALVDRASAQLQGVVKVGFDYGGDSLVTVRFIDGSTASIDANEGFYLAGGIAWIDDVRSLESHLTIGWKSASINAANGDLDFTRFPLEAMVFYNTYSFRYGGGLTYHLNPELKVSGAAPDVGRDYDDAVGIILQVDYRATDYLGIGLRYTVLEYSGPGDDARANGLGLTVTGTF